MIELTDNEQMNLSSGISAFEGKSFGDASMLLSPLAEMGHPEAQYRMAIMTQNGLGLVENHLMAFKYMRSAATAGMAYAQHGLGFMYYVGECVEKNPAKAIEWFQKAADQGMVGSLTTMASMYRDGDGIEQDEKEAQRLFKLAGFDEM